MICVPLWDVYDSEFFILFDVVFCAVGVVTQIFGRSRVSAFALLARYRVY